MAKRQVWAFVEPSHSFTHECGNIHLKREYILSFFQVVAQLARLVLLKIMTCLSWLICEARVLT